MSRLYALLNDSDVRSQIVAAACQRYGYLEQQVKLRLYVGRFAAPTKGDDERAIRAWAATQIVESGAIKVVGVADVVDVVQRVAVHNQYRDDAALVALTVVDAAGHLKDMKSGGRAAHTALSRHANHLPLLHRRHFAFHANTAVDRSLSRRASSPAA